MFILQSNTESFELSCSIQACQAYRALKQDDPQGSYTLKRGDDILMSHNSEDKSIYFNCNSNA